MCSLVMSLCSHDLPMTSLIGATPTLASHPRKFCVVDHAQTTTEKNGKPCVVDRATVK